MATLGQRYIDDGKIYQPWVPVVGDIRPEGLEFRSPVTPQWETSKSRGVAVDECDIDIAEYRVPAQLRPGDVVRHINQSEYVISSVEGSVVYSGNMSAYIYHLTPVYLPPDGWIAVPDDETVKDGDSFSHDENGIGDDLNWIEIGTASSHVGKSVSEVRRLPGGGWVLRRVEKCESAKSAAEKGIESGHSGEHHTDIQSNASPAGELVTWTPRKCPLEKVEIRRELLKEGDEITPECLWFATAVDDWLTFGEACHGRPFNFVKFRSPACRPVYSTPEFKSLADVPEGRVVRQGTAHHWRHGQNWYMSPKDGLIQYGSPTGLAGFEVTDLVMELRQPG